MDIAFVFHDLRAGAGGLIVDIRNLANGLVARGHRVHLLGPSIRPGEELATMDERIHVVQLPPVLGNSRPGRQLALTRGARALLRRIRPQIVQVVSCLPKGTLLTGARAGRAVGAKIVWLPMIHPLRRRQWIGTPAGIAMRPFDAAAPRMARWVDAVVAATPGERLMFERHCARVVVIPPAVDDRPPRPSDEAGQIRARFGIDDAPMILMLAARVEPRKGFAFAGSVVDRVRGLRPDATFALAGVRGELPEGLARAQVASIGFLSEEDLERALRAADVVFVPSVYEAFSRVVIEAWQQATPVVVTDGIGLADVVAGHGGEVVPFGDAATAARTIARLIEDPPRLRVLGENGRRLVRERYTVDRIVDASEELYRSLLA